MKINRTLFVVLLAGFLFGLATSQVKGRAQDITPTLPPPTFKWDLEIELTEEAVLVIQADTSTAGRKSSSSLGPQWTARVRPLERLCHRPVEIVDKIEDACAQVF